MSDEPAVESNEALEALGPAQQTPKAPPSQDPPVTQVMLSTRSALAIASPVWQGIGGLVAIATLLLTLLTLRAGDDWLTLPSAVAPEMGNVLTQSPVPTRSAGIRGTTAEVPAATEATLPLACAHSPEITNAHLRQPYSPPENNFVWVYYEPGRQSEVSPLLSMLNSSFPQLQFKSKQIPPSSGLCSGCLAIYYRDEIEKGLAARLCRLLAEPHHRPAADPSVPVTLQNVLAGRNTGNRLPFSVWIAD